jgi:hypothetical protein
MAALAKLETISFDTALSVIEAAARKFMYSCLYRCCMMKWWKWRAVRVTDLDQLSQVSRGLGDRNVLTWRRQDFTGKMKWDRLEREVNQS